MAAELIPTPFMNCRLFMCFKACIENESKELKGFSLHLLVLSNKMK